MREDQHRTPTQFAGMRVTVMGLGSFGGGVGAVRFLAERGAIVTVSDQRSAEQLAESLAELVGLPEVTYKLGGHDPADFAACELLVVNPAVKRSHPLLIQAASRGVPLTSEMNLFWQQNPALIVAVTGSNGKSTTTALIASILQHTGQQTGRIGWLGGNLGRSLLSEVEQIQPHDFVVLELSSFQLQDLNRLAVSPRVAVVTNFSPNHLDWHASLAEYRDAKQTILRWQSASDFAILNADDAEVAKWPNNGQRWLFGDFHSDRQHADGVFWDAVNQVARIQREGKLEIWPLQEWLTLPGRHNLQNALAATAAAIAAGADRSAVEQGLRSYQPLPHRLQFVGEWNGRRFYNDSLATTPESTIVALQAFAAPIILLAGGYDKQIDLTQMAEMIARRTKGVVLLGQTGPRLEQQIHACANNQSRVIAGSSNLLEAFFSAVRLSEPGDVILLSPGCASYDWFRNFADRGTQFGQLVDELTEPAG